MSDKIKVLIDKDIEEIVPMFLENREKDLIEIQNHLNDNNLGAIEVIAHKLAGNAGSYGFTDMGLIGARMEASCQASKADEVTALYEEYKNYLSQLEVEYK